MRKIRLLGYDLQVAERFLDRLRGLIARPQPRPGEGMLITRCNCVHTFFMRYPIRVIFLDGEDRPVKDIPKVRPFHPFVWGGWRARKVIEVPSMGEAL